MHCNPPLLFKYTLAIGSFCIMTYFITACIRQYSGYPTQTRVSVRLDRFQSFPAVTICSGNPVRYDKFVTPLISYIFSNNLLASPPNLTRDDVYRGAFTFMVDLFNRNQTDTMLAFGFRLKDILLDCSYNGYDCQTMWTETLSPILGNCYTFNRQTVDRTMPLFQINQMNGANQVFHEGLTATFYINLELYFPINEYGIGLTGLLHNPNEQPLVRYSGKHFAPGFEHNLVYENSLSTYLGSPYSACTANMRDDMKSLYRLFDNNTDYGYSQTVCLELCYQTYMYEQCGCVYPVYFYLNQLLIGNRLQWVRTCTPWTSEYRCTIQARQNIANSPNSDQTRCAHCAPQCAVGKYFNDLSALKGPTDSEKFYYTKLILANSTIPVMADFAINSSYYLDRNYLKLNIVPSSSYVTTYTEQATYSWSALVSDLGGQSGLWLGLSALSLFGLVEYLYDKLKAIQSKKKNTSTSVEAFGANSTSKRKF